MNLDFVVLGSGEMWCENELRSLSARLSNFKAIIGYNEGISHLIEAGSDFFLMPSRYEPCGLNQMYSLLYGTPPIVRRTGGLVDTVENYNEADGTGTGFMFDDLTPRAVYDTVGWAVWAYYNRKNEIQAMRARGMGRDFSWAASAQKYIDMYTGALARAKGAPAESAPKRGAPEKKAPAESAAEKGVPENAARRQSRAKPASSRRK
jgi:starch synthase